MDSPDDLLFVLSPGGGEGGVREDDMRAAEGRRCEAVSGKG
jgi:hypothetical protein